MCDVIIAGPHGCGFGWMAMTAGEDIAVVPAASGNVLLDGRTAISIAVHKPGVSSCCGLPNWPGTWVGLQLTAATHGSLHQRLNSSIDAST